MSGCTFRYFWVTVPKLKKGKKRKAQDGDIDDVGNGESVNGGHSEVKRSSGGGSEEGVENKTLSASPNPPSPPDI